MIRRTTCTQAHLLQEVSTPCEELSEGTEDNCSSTSEQIQQHGDQVPQSVPPSMWGGLEKAVSAPRAFFDTLPF